MLSKKNILTTSVVAAALILSGCNTTSSDTTSTDNVNNDVQNNIEETVDKFAGDLSLSGKVEVGNLAKSISFKTNIRKAGSASSDEIVKLYVINEDGDMEDTNITCPVDPTTHEYSCENIAGDQEYIVRYMKNLGNGKVYEMKTSVTVEDEPVTDGKINKITTLIAQAITDAVEEGLASVKDVDQKTIKTLMVKIKQSITESVSNLIKKGLIQVPDDSELVVELDDGKTFDDFVGSTTEDNNKLSQASGIIVSDDNVSKVLDSSKNEAKLKNYASMSKKELIREIFNQTSDGDVPEWVVEFLADKANETLTLDELDNEIVFNANNDELEWIAKDLEMIANTTAQELDLESKVNELVTTINDNIKSGKLRKAFINELKTYKAAKEKNNLDVLSKFPPIIGYLLGNLDIEKVSKLDVSQSLVYIMFAENVYVRDVQKIFFLEKLKLDETAGNMLVNRHFVDFKPEFLFEKLGLNQQTIKAYDKPEVEEFDVRIDNFWDPETGKEIEFTSFNVGVTKASWMLGGFKFDKDKLQSVTLKYPTKDGEKTKVLSSDDFSEVHSWEGGFGVGYNPWSICDGDGPCEPNKDRMDITDNISGTYTVIVKYDGEEFTKTEDKFVLKNARKLRPKLTNPLAMPEWPEELNEIRDWTNLTPKQQELQKAFDKANEEYMKATGGKGYTTFALKEGEDSLKDIVIKWDDSKLKDKIKELKLPKNIVPAYQVGISLYEPDINGDGEVTDTERDQCMMDWNKCNTEIFNTWWQEKPIMANSLMLPIELKENSGEGRYQTHVDLVFIDKKTGREVAHGGNSFAEFKVGDVSALSGEEYITFKGHIATDSNDTKLPSTIKVAFMKDSCTFDEETMEHYCKSDVVKLADIDKDGNYEVSVNAKKIQQGLLDMNGGYSVIAFDDNVEADGVWQQWTPKVKDDEITEPGFWPDNTWINFENWGDFRIGIDREGEYTSFAISKDKNITVDGIDITVWSYYLDKNEEE